MLIIVIMENPCNRVRISARKTKPLEIIQEIRQKTMLHMVNRRHLTNTASIPIKHIIKLDDNFIHMLTQEKIPMPTRGRSPMASPN
jgi:hypothetical protein